MLKAFQILLHPGETWQKIALEERGVVWVLCTHLLPWLALGVGAETYGLIHWGLRNNELGRTIAVSQETAYRYGGSEAVLLLLCVLIGSAVLFSIVKSFNVHSSYARCFAVMAYAFSPVFLSRAFDAIPMIPTWLCWAAGVFGACVTLYNGVGVVLRPDQTKGFAIYMLAGITAAGTSAIAHALALAVLAGKLLK